MRRFLLDIKTVTTRLGRCVMAGEDITDALGSAADYFNHGLSYQGEKPTEVWFDSEGGWEHTDLSVHQEITPPGPYIVYWRMPGDPDDLEHTFETIGLASLMAEGIRKSLPTSIGRLEYVDNLEYEGSGDWAWEPSIQMWWGQEE